MDQERNFQRLKNEQEKALNETNANIDQWEKFRSDYKSLKSRLKTLPDKVTHDVMVPFGPLAFMPGKLVHTNEILVLLGDNWFVERSAKQSCEIIDRRVKSINKEIENLKKQKQLLQPRIETVSKQFTGQGDTFEITEEYDEEKEKLWREQHRKNVQAHKKRKQKTENEEQKPLTDEELWERLDQLERLELERKEMNKVTSEEVLLHKGYDSDDSIMSIESGSDSEDLDTNDHENSESTSESCNTDDERSDTQKTTKTIKFTHTASKKHRNYEREDSTDVEFQITSPARGQINSPADIYAQFCDSKPKSILKSTTDNRQQSKKQVILMTESESISSSTELSEDIPIPVAFSGSVVERSSEVQATSETENVADKPVRMSKFKARRQGLDQV